MERLCIGGAKISFFINFVADHTRINMKRALRLSIIIGVISIFSYGIISCEPEKPVTPIIPPTPGPAPNPGPEPTPEPTPEPEPEESVIYYDNLDGSTTSGVWFDQAGSCFNPEGSGCDDLSYASSSAKVIATYPSSGYPGASGKNGVYYLGTSSYIQVRNIELPRGAKVFKISVGLHSVKNGSPVIAGKTFNIGILDERSKTSDYQNLDFSVKNYGNWAYATAVFEILSEQTTHLSIQISSLEAQVRSDDLMLVSTTAKPDFQVTFDYSSTEEPNYDYIERPKTLKSNSNYKYIDHRATTYRSKKEVRNYEACYDTRRHNPMWVAFPCHAIYNEGRSIRPSRDPWRPDPEMTDDEQSVIYASDWDNWPNNTYRYWSGVSDGKFTVKGHLLGSADRGSGNKNELLDLNVQTFYPTNVAPELYLNDTGDGSYDSSHWGIIERLRQDKWVCSDTLYVVVGCAYEHEDWVLYDDVSGSNYASTSKPCVMPTARYLLALRTKSGTSGKPIWKCSADEVMAIGFWFPQRFDKTTLSSLPPLSDYTFSVSEIESKIGGEFSFFPLAPAEALSQKKISDWPGLQEVSY